MTTVTPAPQASAGGDQGIQAGLIWFNGKIVPQEEAKVSVLAHALHYGTSVFEGLRAYETPRGPAVFRLQEHTRRLFDSALIMRMTVPYSQDEVNQA
ncbi:MAG TPA: branched chain amino acid aminotransferase, partial [Chloroflexota bacterium]|nr:branched chain amino acid aminotransferase [Chloroflexota bacterium]